MNNEDVALVLKHAYGLIENGWVQGTVHDVIDGKDHYCLVGAISQAALTLSDVGSSYAVDNPLYREARSALALALPAGFESVPDFNDRRATTKEDVLQVIEKAIEAALKEASDG